MTTLEYAPFDKEDNVWTLSEEESKEAGIKFESIKRSMNDGLISFTCSETLEQLWYEIDNLELNSEKIKSISRHSLFNMVPKKYDIILHVYLKVKELHDNNRYDLDRCGDLVLGIDCEQEGPVEVYIGDIHKFTKQCNIGFNAFTRDEVIPMIALCYHKIEINGPYVSNIIYGTILSETVRKQLIGFYALDTNPSMYHVVNGLDSGVVKKRNEETKSVAYPVLDVSKIDWSNSEEVNKILYGCLKSDAKKTDF